MRRTLTLLVLLTSVLALGALTAQYGEAAPHAQEDQPHGVIFEFFSNYG